MAQMAMGHFRDLEPADIPTKCWTQGGTVPLHRAMAVRTGSWQR